MKTVLRILCALGLAVVLLYASGINQTDLFATSTVTNQSTSQSTVTLATSPPVGIYHLYYYVDLNTPCTTGENEVTFSFNWTDAAEARTLTTGTFEMTSANSASEFLSGVIPMYVASGNVTYSSTVPTTCSTGTSSYDIHVWMKVN